MNKSMGFWLVIVLAFFVGWFGHKQLRANDGADYVARTKLVRENSSQYSFTNPLLFIDNSNSIFSDLNPLKNKIEDIKAQALREGSATNVSVYFRDLNTTRWTGIDEEELYDPASMLKVLLLIAYLRAAEDKPELIEEKLYYTGDTDKESFFSAQHDLIKGRYYPVKDLIIDMIVKSGNDSTSVLFDRVDKGHLEQVYDDLGFPFPVENQPELMSAKMYSRLFRVLYSSTYLQRSLSEEVLKLLSQVEFKDGLSQGVEGDVLISHKFGERSTTLSNGSIERQLHDCGIIYYPDHPYFLCVMTKGSDFTKLSKVIADISEVAYQYWSYSH